MCVAMPAKIISIGQAEGPSLPARVAFATGSELDVDLAMVPEATIGDHVIVHSGFAVSRLSEPAAAEALRLLEEARERIQ